MSLGGSAPDYSGAAEAQSRTGQELINAQTQANRPNISTPWGNLTWNQTQTPGVLNPERQQLEQQMRGLGDTPWDNMRRRALQQQLSGMPEYTTAPSTSWDMNVQLTPEQQQALQAQQQIQQGRSDLAQHLMGQAGEDVSRGIDWSQFGDVGTGDAARQQAIDAAYGQASSRLDPQWGQREDALRTQLANQGLDIGSEAYQGAMGELGRQRNDAYTSAMNAAIGQGTAAGQAIFGQDMQRRQQQIGEANQRQYGALNAMNALLGGQQVAMPSFPGFSQAGAAQAPNYLGAATALGQYNLANNQAQQGMFGDMFGGLGSFGSGLFGFSDARLKRRVRRSKVEIIPGVRLARWEWPDGSAGFGVIAQDVAKVAPQYVARHASGYLMVDYGGFT
jgi:hypothetical protein